MSFPRYPKYKASGVEWLGDVPAHWTVRPLRSLGAAYGGLTGKTADDFTDDGPHTAYFVPFTNILNNTEIQPGRLDPVQVEPGDTQNEVRSGDLLFLMSSEDYEFLGYSSVVCRIPPRTFLNSFCKGFRPTVADANPSYLNYYCRSRFGRALISRLGFGFTRINLRTGALLSTPVLFPPLPEQRAIAAFLDRETVKIDGLVAAQRRLIELLKEKRQAVISHAVTKGLDPKAPMKPSGVEWLGDVPAHWEVKRLRQIGRLLKGGGGTKEDVVDAGVPCVRYGDLYTTFSYHITRPRGFVTPERVPDYTPLHFGDVLFAASGEKLAEIGKSAVNLLTAPAVCGGDVVILRPEIEVESRFLGYACDSPTAAMQKASLGRGTTVKHIYPDELRLILLSLPPLPEQRAIAAFLDRETAKIDTLVAEAESAITLLQERRSALISAAVTGQIDVRNAVATEAA